MTSNRVNGQGTIPTDPYCLNQIILNGYIDRANSRPGLKMAKLSIQDSIKMTPERGQWLIYNPDGTVKYKVEYTMGYKRQTDGYR